MKKISYIVYPPNYQPGVDSYKKIDTKRKAFKLAIKLGNKAEVIQALDIQRPNGGGLSMNLDAWEVHHDKYLCEFMRNFRYLKDGDMTCRTFDAEGKSSNAHRKYGMYLKANR